MSRSYPTRPHVGVGAVVWRGDRFLLAQRGRPPSLGSWTLPGGGQNLGETVAEAARREVLEETGLTVEVLDVVAVVDLIHRDDSGRIAYHYTVVDLLAEWRAGEAVAGDDAAAVAWLTLDDLPRFQVSADTERVVRLSARMRQAGG